MMTDYTDIDEIPEWAKQMACDKANARADCVLWVPREIGAGFGVLDALALMCWQYCDEPVDPDLLIAREAVAQVCERQGSTKGAAEYRAGKWDHILKDTPAIIAARLAREQGAK